MERIGQARKAEGVLDMIWKKEICRVVLAAAFGIAVCGTALADDNTFVQGTTVNGLGVSGMTVDEAADHIKTFYSNDYQLKINERNGVQEVIKGSDIGFAVGLPDGYLQGLLDEQNAGGRASGPDVNSRFRVELSNSYSEELLTEKINSLNCISGSNLVQAADAHVSAYEEGKPFEIVKEVRGTNADPERTAAAVRNAVATGATELSLEDAGCYYEIKVTADSEELKNLCDTMNRCREMTITYKIGESQELLDSATICSWLLGTQDGEIQVDMEKAAAFVKTLADTYDTSGTTRSFWTVTGRVVEVTGPYGWKIDQAGETAALAAMIRTGQTQEREPQYASTAVTRTSEAGPEWGNTYAEVDLTNQHVYMIKDGQLVWDAPCVTGNASKGYDTPAGFYSLAYKERDRVLRGTKRADGTYEYESPVSYWMPFNGGIGFHDANWRGSFGGTIYKTNGSHGCVNLPPSKAAALYDLVYKGMPVICYQ